MADIEIRRADGTVDRVKLPDFMMESTAKSMAKNIVDMSKSNKGIDDNLSNVVDLLNALVKSNDKAMDAYEDLVLKDLKPVLEDIKDETKDGLSDVSDTVKEEMSETRKSINYSLADLDKTLTKFNIASLKILGSTAAVFGAAVGTLVGHTLQFGNEVADLVKTGQGYDSMGMSIANTVQSFNELGLSTTDATGVIKEYSNVVATTGRSSFVKATKALNELTSGGSELGLSMGDLVNIYGDDMKRRQQLGILNQMDSQRAAKRTTELYNKQLEYAKRLGTSVEELQDTLSKTADSTDFMLSMQRIAGRKGTEAAAEMLMAVQDTMSDLRASGMDQSLLDMIGEEAAGAGRMLTEGGQQMHIALASIGGPASAGVRDAMEEYRLALQSGDSDAIKKASDRMKGSMETMGQSFNDMSDAEFSRLKIMAKTNPAMEALLKSSIQARTAFENEAKFRDEQGKAVADLAENAKAYDNAMNKLSGSFEGVMNAAAGSFAPVMQGFANAMSTNTAGFAEFAKNLKETTGEVVKMPESFDELVNATGKTKEAYDQNIGLMTYFQLALREIGSAFTEAIGGVSGDVNSLGAAFKEKLIPVIRSVTEFFVDNMDTIIGTFQFMGGVLSGVANGIYFAGKLVVSLFQGVSYIAGVVSDSFNAIVDKGVKPVIKFLRETFVPFDYLIIGLGKLGDVVSSGFDTIKKWFGFTNESTSAMADLGSAIGTAVGAIIALSAAVKAGLLIQKAYNAAKAVGSKVSSGVSSLMGGGSGGSAKGGILDAVSRTTQGSAKGAGNLNIGKGTGAAIQSFAKGLGAVGPMILKGATFLAGAIVVISAAIAGSAWLFKETGALETLSAGFKSFNEIDGVNLLAVGGGMIALGAGLAAMGAGSVIGAVGNLIGAGWEKIGDALGVKGPLQKLQEFGNMQLNVEGIRANSEAIGEYVTAMASLDSVSKGIGDAVSSLFDNNDLIDNLEDFAEVDHKSLRMTANSIDVLAVAYSKFANLDSDAIGRSAKAIEKLNAAAQAEATAQRDNAIKGAVNKFASFFGVSSDDTKATVAPTPNINNSTVTNTVENNEIAQQAQAQRPDVMQSKILDVLLSIENNTRQGAKYAKTTQTIISKADLG